MALPFSAIILTYNEEQNLPDCLQSLGKLAHEVFVVDSGSTDRTIEIARAYGATVYTHPFENYAQQRNWALRELPVQTERVLNMDADHRLTPELYRILETMAAPEPAITGFLVSRRTLFLGKWIRYGGHYPVYHAVLFRRGYGHCEEKLYNQRFKVEGRLQRLHGDMIDILTDSLTTFTGRHNRWATLEALDQHNGTMEKRAGVIEGRITGNPIQQRRYLKSLYEKMPLFVRPFLYFFIRYFLRLGFLDGRRGLIFHFLQCFWFRFLVDAKLFELRFNRQAIRSPKSSA